MKLKNKLKGGLKMNKKILSGVIVVSLLSIFLVAAILVPYLSDKTEVIVDVTSPFEIKSLSGGQGLPNYDELGFENSIKIDVVGGDTYEVTFGFKALSNNAMDVIEQYVIGGNGTTCADFIEIGWFTCTIGCTEWAGYNTVELSDSVQCNDSSGRIIINAPNHYDVGETNVNKLVLTLQSNAEGNYSISAQVLPVTT